MQIYIHGAFQLAQAPQNAEGQALRYGAMPLDYARLEYEKLNAIFLLQFTRQFYINSAATRTCFSFNAYAFTFYSLLLTSNKQLTFCFLSVYCQHLRAEFRNSSLDAPDEAHERILSSLPPRAKL